MNEVNFNLPAITAEDADTKIAQLNNYMYQLVEKLNWAFSSNPSDNKVNVVETNIVGVTSPQSLIDKMIKETSIIEGSSVALGMTHVPCIIPAGSNQLLITIPLVRYVASPRATCDSLDIILRHADGGHPYIRSGSSGGTYTQAGSGYVSIWNEGKTVRTNEVESVSCIVNKDVGINVTVVFKYPLAKASGNTAAVTANVPAIATIRGNFTF